MTLAQRKSARASAKAIGDPPCDASVVRWVVDVAGEKRRAERAMRDAEMEREAERQRRRDARRPHGLVIEVVENTMTDLERFKHLVSTAPLESIDEMRRIVEKNQNQPPEGAADGSFSDDQWEAARGFVDAVKQLRRCASKLW